MGFKVSIQGSRKRVIFQPTSFAAGDVVTNTLLSMGGERISILVPPKKDDFAVEVVREHGEALVSAWLEQEPDMEFSAFIDQMTKRFRGRLYSYSMPNYYLRYEILQYEFDLLCLIAGLPETQLIGFNPVKVSWRKYVTQPIYNKIQSAFGQEMEFLGYGTFAKR